MSIKVKVITVIILVAVVQASFMPKMAYAHAYDRAVLQQKQAMSSSFSEVGMNPLSLALITNALSLSGIVNPYLTAALNQLLSQTTLELVQPHTTDTAASQKEEANQGGWNLLPDPATVTTSLDRTVTISQAMNTLAQAHDAANQKAIVNDLADLIAATTDQTDTDGDGLPDSVEAVLGTNPDEDDSDFDRLDDYYEAVNEFRVLKMQPSLWRALRHEDILKS